MHRARQPKPPLSKAEARILEQCWKLGTCSVREILESLPDDERVAYTTVQTLVLSARAEGRRSPRQEDRQRAALRARARPARVPPRRRPRAARPLRRLAAPARLQPARDRHDHPQGPEDAPGRAPPSGNRRLPAAVTESRGSAMTELPTLATPDARGRDPSRLREPRRARRLGGDLVRHASLRRRSTGSGWRPRSTSSCRPACSSIASGRPTSPGPCRWRTSGTPSRAGARSAWCSRRRGPSDSSRCSRGCASDSGGPDRTGARLGPAIRIGRARRLPSARSARALRLRRRRTRRGGRASAADLASRGDRARS